MSLQIIKVNLCGVFALFIAHKLPDQLATELCKSGRPTLSSDPPYHRFLLPLVLRTGTRVYVWNFTCNAELRPAERYIS